MDDTHITQNYVCMYVCTILVIETKVENYIIDIQEVFKIRSPTISSQVKPNKMQLECNQ